MMLTTVSEEMQKKNTVPSVYYEMDAAGVVFLGQIEKNYLEYYVEEKIPCLMMLLHHYGVKADYVLSANVDGAFLVTKYLISCGHKKNRVFCRMWVFYSSFVERLWGIPVCAFRHQDWESRGRIEITEHFRVWLYRFICSRFLCRQNSAYGRSADGMGMR